MTIKKFNYKDKDREVVVIYKSDTSLAGIDLNYLNEEEKKEGMRAYRRFKLDTSELFKEKEEN